MLAKTVRATVITTAELPKKVFARRILFWPLGIVCLGLVVLLILKVSPLYWISAVVWTAGWLLALGLLARSGWLPGTPVEVEFTEGKFCEAEEENSSIKQPVNTFSNMGFVVAGLLILLIAGTRTGSATNPMADGRSLVPLVYGLSVIFMGPGSMFFHASGKLWAGWFDTISMVGWAGFSLSYTASQLLAHWFGWSQVTLLIMAVLIIGGLGVITLRRDLPNFRKGQPPVADPNEVKGGLDEIVWVAIGWLILEAVFIVFMLFGNPPPFRRSLSWLIAAFIAFGAAFTCWIPSNGRVEIEGIKQQWCKPDSWYQGHAFWHLFSAIGTLMIYLYFASEVST